ncbi:MAG: phospho-sugar mutase [Odoribacteraceae bacterium]|jgi:phosphoglucomutase|nr:phospho-sugar mutase [Odoribacteraceae bacterium]
MENMDLIEIARGKARDWLDDAYDNETRESVRQMLQDDDPTALVDAFYKDLEFGTGGLRGIMGAGSNRMNIYTVGAATQGFARYINQQFPGEPRAVCIGHDCRHGSRLFAETAAAIFSANGIDVYLFDALRPTPEVSFAIRELGCKGGVIITASHNPKEYNGYKAYWDDGAQLVPPHDENVINEVKKIKVPDIRFERVPERIHALGEEIDRRYLEQVRQLRLAPDMPMAARDLKIVFSPLHGTTFKLVPASLRLWGFHAVYPVPGQDEPDGNFPTVALANPEDPAAFKMALDVAREVDADLVMACDPDGDRIGISVKNHQGEWVLLDGNQTYLVFLEYIIRGKRRLGLLSGDEYVVKTIVTTELVKVIAEKNGIACHDVYTGFKWIADAIRHHGPEKYIGGGEESFGFMPGAFTRDKDGIASASMMAEIAAWCKANNSSIYAFLEEIYVAYGFSRERLVQVTRQGASGAREIAGMMERLRREPPRQLNGVDVVLRKDFLAREAVEPLSGRRYPIPFDTASDVLQFFLADGSKVSARPSGTEPKIKFYFETRVQARDLDDLERARSVADQRVNNMISSIMPG